MAASFDGFSPLEPNDPSRISPYQLLARLGAGGMGRVYLSSLPGGRPVALKVVHDGFAADPEFRRRFALEARAAQQVNGIHIAQLLDVGADALVPWLATAYIAGPSLQEAVRLHGPLPTEAVRMLAAATARALAAVHQAGLIHRDLKPANVILAEDGPRVIDFGVARAVDSTTTGLTHGRVGSAQYMAPEQVRGLAATPALDVFALGALIFFAATGRPAFGEGEDLAVIFRIVQEEPDLSGCPPVVRDLVAACLNKDPARRPDLKAVIRYCEGDAPIPISPGWLPHDVAQSARARAESAAALIAQQIPPRPLAAPGPIPTPGPVPTPTLQAPVTLPPPPRTSWTTGKVIGLVAGVAVLSAAIAVAVVLATRSSSTNGGTASGNDTSSNRTSNTSNSAGPTTATSKQPGGTSSGTSSTTSGDTNPQSPTSAPSSESTAPATDVAAGSDPIVWQGTVILGKNGVTLGPTAVTQGGGDLAFELQGQMLGGYQFIVFPTSGSAVVQWTQSARPTRQDCVSALGANGGDYVYVPVGAELCVEGADKQVAAVKVVAVDPNSTQATMKFVLWSQPVS